MIERGKSRTAAVSRPRDQPQKAGFPRGARDTLHRRCLSTLLRLVFDTAAVRSPRFGTTAISDYVLDFRAKLVLNMH